MFLLQSTQWTQQAVLDCTAECLPFAVLHGTKTSVDFFRPNFESGEDSCSADAKDKRQWRGGDENDNDKRPAANCYLCLLETPSV